MVVTARPMDGAAWAGEAVGAAPAPSGPSLLPVPQLPVQPGTFMVTPKPSPWPSLRAGPYGASVPRNRTPSRVPGPLGFGSAALPWAHGAGEAARHSPEPLGPLSGWGWERWRWAKRVLAERAVPAAWQGRPPARRAAKPPAAAAPGSWEPPC